MLRLLPRFRTFDSVARELIDGLRDGSVVLDAHEPPQAPPPVTWAGKWPHRPGATVVGTVDGRLMLLHPDRPGGLLLGGSSSGLPITGAAFFHDQFVCSTLNDLSLCEFDRSNGRITRLKAPHAGAQCVTVTREGLFVAAGLEHGFMFARWEESGEPSIFGFSGTLGRLFVNRVAVLNGRDNSQLVFAACREDGFAFVRVRGPLPEPRVDVLRHPGVDVVDVCSLRQGSFAAMALMGDGSLVAMPDATDPTGWVESRPAGPMGRPLRVHSQDGHVFVLTDTHLLYIHDWVRSFTGAGVLDVPPSRAARMNAVDLGYDSEGKLLIVQASGRVTRYDFRKLTARTAALLAVSEVNKPEDEVEGWTTNEEAAWSADGGTYTSERPAWAGVYQEQADQFAAIR